jgi:hypothetical protein
MSEKVTCEKCGAEYGIGQFPFCRGNVQDHGQMQGFDEAFEPYVDCQLLDRKDPRCDSVNKFGVRGVLINSRSERRNLMKSLGLQYGTQKWDRRGETKYFDRGSGG